MKNNAFICISLLLIYGTMMVKSQAGIVVVNPGENLNTIINKSAGGDTVLVKPGIYEKVIVENKKFTEKKPLVIKASGPGPAIIKGETISRGSSLELNNCSYIVLEGFALTNSMWGIYVKNSEHIILMNNEIHNTGQEGCHIGRSSKYIDAIGNKIHDTGLFNSKWGEGIYIGSGSYSQRNSFPDNCEFIWIENNHIYETGNGEAINIKAESFHVTVRNNKIHDIHPGTAEQYNQAAISVDAAGNSIPNNYRLSEKRDVWVENNTIRNVSEGYSDWNNGIMFFGTGVYILNNTISDCANRGIYGNSWKNLNLENHVFGNSISGCNTNMEIHPDLHVVYSAPLKNPHTPQDWYSGYN